jgi:hypothetical protein
MQTKTVTFDDVKLTLAWSADSRRRAQEKVDKLQARFERLHTRLSIHAHDKISAGFNFVLLPAPDLLIRHFETFG